MHEHRAVPRVLHVRFLGVPVDDVDDVRGLPIDTGVRQ